MRRDDAAAWTVSLPSTRLPRFGRSDKGQGARNDNEDFGKALVSGGT